MNDTLLEEVNGDILIVDDNLNDLQLLSDLLGSKGYEVRGARNGQAALTFIDKDPPELILLDIRMPEMDGYEVCERLKSDKKYRNIPVIFLSGLQRVDEKVKGFEAGAVDFITKPFQAAEALARVGTHITLSRLSRNLEQQVEERTTELIKTDEQLRMMKTAFEKAMDPVVFINSDGRFIYANEASVKESGHPRDKLLSLHTYDIGPDYTPEIWRDHFQELKRVGSMRLQNKIVTEAGDTILYDVRSNHVQIGEKEFIHSCGRDITELIMAQQALTEQLEFERLIAEIAAALAQANPEQLGGTIDTTLQNLGRFLHTERALVKESMQLTEKESAVFWRLYDDHEKIDIKIFMKRSEHIRRYIHEHKNLSDKKAESLMNEYLQIEAESLSFKRAMVKNFSDKLPAKKVYQYFVLEELLEAGFFSQIAENLPQIE